VRPVIDTLQTMPLFVILLPFVMVFKSANSPLCSRSLS